MIDEQTLDGPTRHSRREYLQMAAAAMALPVVANAADTAAATSDKHTTNGESRRKSMTHITVGQENSKPIELYYED